MKSLFRKEPNEWQDWFREDPRDKWNFFLALLALVMGMVVAGVVCWAIWTFFERL